MRCQEERKLKKQLSCQHPLNCSLAHNPVNPAQMRSVAERGNPILPFISPAASLLSTLMSSGELIQLKTKL